MHIDEAARVRIQPCSLLRCCAEHYPDELAECLDDAILQDFNVEAEDGSPDQVGTP